MLRRLFPGCREQELISSCGAQAAHCGGASCCGAWALGLMASVVVAPRLQSTGSIAAPRHVGSSQTRDRTGSPTLVCVSAVVSLRSGSATPWIVTCQAPLSLGFSRQEYWDGLPYPPPGDLPHPGMEPASPLTCLLHWQADSLPRATREALYLSGLDPFKCVTSPENMDI